MKIKVEKVGLSEILPLRHLFLQENNIQIRYYACHERNWTHSYILKIDDQKIGYGSVKGKDDYLKDRDAIFEFYIIPPFRKHANKLFSELIKSSNAKYIECQSNQTLLPELFYEFSENINTETILFADHISTNHKISDVIFRIRKTGEIITGKKESDMGAYVLEKENEIIATSGFLTHYNFPFADLYMEVKESYRGKGVGSFILQEIKRECYLVGHVPAARCNTKNEASKGALLKAGFRICGYMLIGEI